MHLGHKTNWENDEFESSNALYSDFDTNPINCEVETSKNNSNILETIEFNADSINTNEYIADDVKIQSDRW